MILLAFLKHRLGVDVLEGGSNNVAGSSLFPNQAVMQPVRMLSTVQV